MSTRLIDTSSSTLAVRTRAKGLLSRLAHDLQLEARELAGSVEVEGERWRAELRVPVSALRVAGVVRGGRVERGVLSASDVAEIERRIRHEVLRGEQVTARGEGDRQRASLTVQGPRGTQRVEARLEVADRADREVVSFRCALSLERLGVGEVRGPLGAFKIADEVEVEARIALAPVA